MADDEDSNFNLIREMFSETKATLVHAKNDRQTIQQVVEIKPDLILMDIKMPGMETLEVARQIKNLFPKIFIVATTPGGNAANKEKCSASGCDGYITKPINKELLMRIVWEAMEHGVKNATK